jgi:hypothetical protein
VLDDIKVKNDRFFLSKGIVGRSYSNVIKSREPSLEMKRKITKEGEGE